MTTLVETAKSKFKTFGFAHDLLMVMGGSLFILLCAQVAFPLWFTPIQLTLQSFAVLLIGATLGSKRGALAVFVYLTEGALGFPAFGGGCGGLDILSGLGAGYLFGFVFAAYLVGWLLEKGWKQSSKLTLCALALGGATILALGAFWLSFYVGPQNVFKMGVAPFLIGDSLKVIGVAVLLHVISQMTK